jgi:signal transduction histidine kinase/ActR/RegA family two-component response regulator
MTAQGTGRGLRFRLFLLAASGLLPLAIVAGVVLAYLTSERERDAQQTALAVSRALATAVDSELRATISVLQSLALSDELQPRRLQGFHELSGRVASGAGWRTVVLADATGKVLFSSNQPFGTAATTPVDPDSMQRAIIGREPVVGGVAEGQRGAGPAFAVRLPVLRQGELHYVLSAVIPTDHILAVLLRQYVPSSSIVAVLDQKMNRVARSRPNAVYRPAPSLEALLRSGASEGMGVTTTLEGMRSFTGFSRLQNWGWVVATGISAEDANRGLLGVIGAVALGLLASLGLAAFVAWYYSRDVIDPIERLKEAAAALGRGEPVHLAPLGIAELEDVAQALQHASAERDRAAKERENLLAQVTEALRRAEDAGRSKDEFLAMLGHELRNPLAPMATALHLMARKGDTDHRRERDVMERQVAHMKRLVDDLLDVSRITGKRLEMRMEPLRLADLVRHAAQAVQPVLGLRELVLEIDADAERLWVSGDEVRLGQVLNNLLGNAIKFTGPEGRIALRLRSAGAEHAEITVQDNGFGMPPEVLAHVFDLFYQAPQGADRSRGGLGLGLAIVRSLVEMHGGSVKAESAGDGRGSNFTLRLPTIAPPAPSASGDAAAVGSKGEGRVLLVDDNRDAADTAAAVLEMAGYNVRVAYDPGVALAILDEILPDVAVLDIGLPGMSGYELAARVRAHPHGANCYLVALTGYGTATDRVKAHDAGFQQHLVKPAPPEALLEAVRHGIHQGGIPP